MTPTEPASVNPSRVRLVMIIAGLLSCRSAQLEEGTHICAVDATRVIEQDCGVPSGLWEIMRHKGPASRCCSHSPVQGAPPSNVETSAVPSEHRD